VHVPALERDRSSFRVLDYRKEAGSAASETTHQSGSRWSRETAKFPSLTWNSAQNEFWLWKSYTEANWQSHSRSLGNTRLVRDRAKDFVAAQRREAVRGAGREVQGATASEYDLFIALEDSKRRLEILV
jgi:hypothetical protein